MKCEWRNGKCENNADEQISGRWTCSECDARIQSSLTALAEKYARTDDQKDGPVRHMREISELLVYLGCIR